MYQEKAIQTSDLKEEVEKEEWEDVGEFMESGEAKKKRIKKILVGRQKIPLSSVSLRASQAGRQIP